MTDLAGAEAGIRQLQARYTDAVWRKDAEAFAACFSPDGEWRISGMALKGREEIGATIARILANANRVLISFRTPILEVGNGVAHGRTYVTEQCSWTHREPNTSIGRYYEHFVEQDGLWLFEWRLFQILYSGPADLSGEWHEQPDFGAPPGMPPRDMVPADHAAAKWQLDRA